MFIEREKGLVSCGGVGRAPDGMEWTSFSFLVCVAKLASKSSAVPWEGARRVEKGAKGP